MMVADCSPRFVFVKDPILRAPRRDPLHLEASPLTCSFVTGSGRGRHAKGHGTVSGRVTPIADSCPAATEGSPVVCPSLAMGAFPCDDDRAFASEPTRNSGRPGQRPTGRWRVPSVSRTPVASSCPWTGALSPYPGRRAPGRPTKELSARHDPTPPGCIRTPSRGSGTPVPGPDAGVRLSRHRSARSDRPRPIARPCSPTVEEPTPRPGGSARGSGSRLTYRVPDQSRGGRSRPPPTPAPSNTPRRPSGPPRPGGRPPLPRRHRSAGTVPLRLTDR